MDAPGATSHHPRVRVLPHITKLDDALGEFIEPVAAGAFRSEPPP
jgi:hypothetical protein